MAYPITGWLADTKLGRRRVVFISIWFCWFGMLLQVASFCIQYGTCGWPVSLSKYGLSGVSFVLMVIGTAGYLANVLPYGIDLLESNVKVRSFIHWNVWSIFIGSSYNFGALLTQTSLNHPNLMMFTSLSTFVLLSIAVSLNTFFADMFANVHNKCNPYSTIANVLVYAARHKVPKQRSAFTYSEEKVPRRIDFAKRKYGGPYTHEVVENVKTFLRILTLLLSLFGFYIAYSSVRDFLPTIMNQFKDGATDLNGFGAYLMWQVLDVLPAALLIPLFELVIIPLYPKVEFFVMNSLRGLIFNHILLLISIFSLFVISTVGYVTSDIDVPCYTIWSIGDPTISFSYLSLLATAALSGFADNFSFLYAFEFICSQSPSSMNGMLIGLFWCVRGTFIQINYFMTLPLTYHPITNFVLSCGFWVTLVPMIFGCVGFICFIIAVKWYHKRERDDREDINYQLNIERHYERYLDQQELFDRDISQHNDIIVCDVIDSSSL
jgi:peptide/histidine transporter 3/4